MTARLLACLAALLLAGAEAPAPVLNPTVALLANPAGAVPPDCATGQAVGAPRLTLDDSAGAAATEAKPAEAPPQSALQAALHRVQHAAGRNDRDGFEAALAAAKRAAASYPPGGEKSAAESLLRLYDDLARLWDYSYSSKTGAFFEPGELLTMLRSYPGYEAAIAENTLVAGDRTLYPAAESRAFLIREADRRLRGGKSSSVSQKRPALRKIPNAAAETPTPKSPSVQVREGTKAHETQASEPKVAREKVAKKSISVPHPPSRKRGNSPAEKQGKSPAEKPAKRVREKSTSAAAVKPAAPTPVPPPAPAPATTTTKPPAAPVAPSTPTPTQTATTATSAPAPATTTTAIPTATTTAASNAPPPGTQTATTASTGTTAGQNATMDTATATTPAVTTATGVTATDTSVTETTATDNQQPTGENPNRKPAKLAIAVLLIVAALAFLVYLFRSGD